LLETMRMAGSSMLAINSPTTDRDRPGPGAIPSAALADPDSRSDPAPAPRIAAAHRLP
jgi:hypothetical protein